MWHAADHVCTLVGLLAARVQLPAARGQIIATSLEMIMYDGGVDLGPGGGGQRAQGFPRLLCCA